MPFWKKSDDPWEMDPAKKRPSGMEEESPDLMDTVRNGWSQMKAEWKERQDAMRLPPEKCPWCGAEMEQGWLYGGRGVFWMRGVPDTKSKWLGAGKENVIRVDREGIMYTYHTAWYCPACRHMALDAQDLKTQAEEDEPSFAMRIAEAEQAEEKED